MNTLGSPAIPRPVADAPLARLLGGCDGLAKAWVIALIGSQPLERAAEIPLAQLTREAPDLCAQILRALASEDELAQLRDGGEGAALAGRVGELAGARDLPGAVAAVESLRAVLWHELSAALDHPSALQVSELANRLAYIASLIITAVLAGRREEPQIEDEPLAALPLIRGPRIEIHDTRGDGPAAWIRSIGSCLERQAPHGLPFAVLLIEVIGIERLRHIEQPATLGRLLADVQSALRLALRSPDVLTRESDGRYWLVAPQLDAREANAVAQRLISTVRENVGHHGAPVEVAVGIAMYPEDGREAAELAASADMKLFAARAAGVSLAPLEGRLDAPDLPI